MSVAILAQVRLLEVHLLCSDLLDVHLLCSNPPTMVKSGTTSTAKTLKPTVKDGANHVRVGCDFSGLCTLTYACKQIALDVPSLHIVHSHACDKMRAPKKVIETLYPGGEFFKDVTTRDVNKVPYADLLSVTAPCQTFSNAGKHAGITDPRGLLVTHSLDLIDKKQPKCVIMENAKTLAGKYQSFMKYIIDRLKLLNYNVSWKILDSRHYGLPQSRVRWYLLAIRKDVQRSNTAGISLWPPEKSSFTPLSDVVKPLPAQLWKPLPDESDTLGRANVLAAYTKLHSQGTNPFKVPVVVDMGASPDFSSFQVNMCPTLTRTRTSGYGYWCSTKGGVLDETDIVKLQGFDASIINCKTLGISKSALGGLIGNAQSLPVVKAVAAHAMYHSKIITLAELQSINL